MRFLPPLIINEEQIDFVVDTIRKAIEASPGSRASAKASVAPHIRWREHFIGAGDEDGAGAYKSALAHVTRVLGAVFESAERPYSGLDPQILKQVIDHQDLSEGGLSLAGVIDLAGELIAKNSIIVQHPRCIAHLHTPPAIVGLAAEAFISALNQSMDSWDQASAATFLEERVVAWLCQRFHLGPQADGVFTAGGTQSNLIGLLLARNQTIKRLSGHQVAETGLPDYAGSLRILCSDQAHFTIAKSAAVLGLGTQAVVKVASHPDGRINVEQLSGTIDALRQTGTIPIAIVGTAGTTDHGAIDDLVSLAALARREELWFHVDGAYGGSLIFGSRRDRLAGIERADSLSIDFHKLCFQPISCGALLLKEKKHFSHVFHRADYLNRDGEDLPNLVDKSLSTTRRFDALKVWMTMQSLGPDELGAMGDYLIELTRSAARLVAESSSYELMSPPILSTVLFRHRGRAGMDTDRFNKRLRQTALRQGLAIIGETTVAGQVSLKLTILNPCLELDVIASMLQELERIGILISEAQS